MEDNLQYQLSLQLASVIMRVHQILTAMVVFFAIDLVGVAYVSGPNPTLGERTSNKAAVFFFQFPRQSLEYKADDSAGLGILYSALLQSVGVER